MATIRPYPHANWLFGQNKCKQTFILWLKRLSLATGEADSPAGAAGLRAWSRSGSSRTSPLCACTGTCIPVCGSSWWASGCCPPSSHSGRCSPGRCGKTTEDRRKTFLQTKRRVSSLLQQMRAPSCTVSGLTSGEEKCSSGKEGEAKQKRQETVWN